MRLLLSSILLIASLLSAQAQAPQLVYSVPLGSTYSSGARGYAGYASPTDVWSITGSATKIIKVINVRVSGYATGSDHISLILVKRSTANSGGTPTTLTTVPWDSVTGAATATLVTYAAAPTLGTLVGDVCACQVELPAKNSNGGSILEWQFNRNGLGPIVLRGTSEVLALNGVSSSFPAGTLLNITAEWVEQ